MQPMQYVPRLVPFEAMVWGCDEASQRGVEDWLRENGVQYELRGDNLLIFAPLATYVVRRGDYVCRDYLTGEFSGVRYQLFIQNYETYVY